MNTEIVIEIHCIILLHMISCQIDSLYFYRDQIASTSYNAKGSTLQAIVIELN